jgi:pimeloyl-ACP methyl ester carboxylesterase
MVSWPSLSPERLEQAEKSLIELSGVPTEAQRIYMDDSETHSTFCLKFGDPSNPALILLHGYLGTSIIFYKLFKRLSKHYMVYCLDLMGFGRSSRPEFTAQGREEAELFFVIPIEICRVKLGLEKFVLAGHSFGGYIAGCYAESFPQYVEKLVFLSAIGIPKAPYSSPEEFLNGLSWKFRLFTRFVKFLLRKDVTPGVILRKLGPFTGNIVRKYMKKRWKRIPDEELDHLEIYVEQVNLYPGSGEFALKELLVEGGFAAKPLFNRVTNTPAVFIYGDVDWMDPEGAEMNAQHNRAPILCETISNSGHHMYIENPKELVKKMIKALKSLDEMR